MSSLHDMCGKNKQIGPWEEKNNPAALGCVLEAGAEIWLFLKGAVIHNFHMTYTYIYIYLHIDYTRMWQYVCIYIYNDMNKMIYISWHLFVHICYIQTCYLTADSMMTFWPFLWLFGYRLDEVGSFSVFFCAKKWWCESCQVCVCVFV